MNQQTNYDEYLEKQLQDSDFAKRFKRAGQAWDVAFQLASLRKDAGLSQKKLARKVGTTQQQIRRLEPQQRAHSPWLAAGLASESKIRQNSLRGLRSTAGRQNFPVACCGELQFVNADLIASGLSPFKPEQAAIKAGRLMLEKMNSLAESRIDFAIETA